MPRKKRPLPEGPPAPAALDAPPHARPAEEPGPVQEPFHAGQCDHCVHYKPAHYIAAAGDLERALAGAALVMGYCTLHHGALTTATREGCPDFGPVPAPEKRRPRRDGAGEWVLR